MKTKTFNSEFDGDAQVAILCKDDYRYDVLKPIFDNYGFGFVSVENKLVCIDGEVKLTKDELKWIEAHEIAHIKLNHIGERSKDDEVDADVLAELLLKTHGYNKAAELVKIKSLERHNKQI